jgi:cAMP-binding proteins - catabolite gene activator and regulatory subunit of cAMP-dependent protein kinases
MQKIQFKAGDTILTEGEEGNSAFLITTGSVEVIIGEGKKAKVVATLGEGTIFGEMSLLEPGPRSATIKAVTNTECAVTSYDDFMASIQDNPEQAIKFMKTLVLRLRQMNEVMGKMDPQRRRMRDMFKDWQKSNEAAELAESERWAKLSQEEREIELNYLGAFRYGMF